ncbi:MAG: lactoylglutathione lyase, partial [Bacteroidetes bacterium]
MIKQTQFILYVSDQNKSKKFYKNILQMEPVLDVPGMTEFQLSSNTKLGLMPETGIAKILQNKVPHPATGNGIPRCEIYLLVDNIHPYIDRIEKYGAKLISTLQSRDWGDKVAYFADLDGHIIAIAEKN